MSTADDTHRVSEKQIILPTIASQLKDGKRPTPIGFAQAIDLARTIQLSALAGLSWLQ